MGHDITKARKSEKVKTKGRIVAKGEGKRKTLGKKMNTFRGTDAGCTYLFGFSFTVTTIRLARRLPDVGSLRLPRSRFGCSRPAPSAPASSARSLDS